jgi:hypothetical protein
MTNKTDDDNLECLAVRISGPISREMYVSLRLTRIINV